VRRLERVARPTAIPWGAILRWTLLSVVVTCALVAGKVVTDPRGAVALLEPGSAGPSRAAIHADFPRTPLPAAVGFDGQQFYAVARDPIHLGATAANLDRPRYRLQRPLFPLLAWMLHPEGGGTGLIVAFVAVGVLALLLGGMATGVLSVTLGGSPKMAAVFALLPGAYLSLRYTVADALALALTVAAVAASARDRRRGALVLAILAVLAKEVSLVVFVGWALARRTRDRAALVFVPGAIAAIWAAFLVVTVPAGAVGSHELGLPLAGLANAVTRFWSHDVELLGLVCTVGAVALGVAALVHRGLRHPLAWIVVTNLVFVSIMGTDVVGKSTGAPRSMMPLQLFAIIALATPVAALRSRRDRDPALSSK
jgi:hypothetical protein